MNLFCRQEIYILEIVPIRTSAYHFVPEGRV